MPRGVYERKPTKQSDITCQCGRTFKSPQGYAGHRKACRVGATASHDAPAPRHQSKPQPKRQLNYCPCCGTDLRAFNAAAEINP